jgi:hypothetical protein
VAVQPADYVAPGQAAWFQFVVVAPTTPGTYELAIRPLIEGLNGWRTLREPALGVIAWGPVTRSPTTSHAPYRRSARPRPDAETWDAWEEVYPGTDPFTGQDRVIARALALRKRWWPDPLPGMDN